MDIIYIVENIAPVTGEQAALEEQLQPLLENNAPVTGEQQKQPKTRAQKAIRKTFKGTAHLSNLLPTGSVLAFELLSPIFTHQGQCQTFVSRFMTLALLTVCGVSCFLLSFTDSFKDARGKVRYGLATFRGLWVIDGSVLTLSPVEADRYKVKFIDFFHAFMAVLIFAAVALFDQNVVKCFNPMQSEETKELLKTVPIGIGVICSILFILFPTKRHGIGFPLSRQ